MTKGISQMDKLKSLLQSRKFWTLIASVVSIGAGYYTGGVDAFQSLQLLIAALAAYSVTTGIEDSGK
jgi:hypothetical protein